MANKIIYLNNKKYSIDEALLSVAINVLKSHFGTAMEGEGASIEFENVKYPIASTKLDAARTEFVSALQSIAGEGAKVTVGGIEFSIDSTKVQGAFDSFTTVLEDLKEQSGGSDSVPAGLYRTGAIALYEEQGAEAIEGMMITPWADLLAVGTIHVEDGLFYTDYNWDDWKNKASDILDGDLVLPNDRSILTLGEFSDSAWEGRPAFLECYHLTGLMIPSSVINVNDCAFNHCTSLTNIVFSKDIKLTSLGLSAFYDCENLLKIEIPESVMFITDYLFYGCSNLTSITIPDSVTSIGEYAFQGCSNLTSITIPDSVTSIGEYAFDGCSSLTSITIPDSVTSIGNSAFYQCDNLISVTIGNSVTTIDSFAFFMCSKLMEIKFNGTVEKWNNIETKYRWNYNIPATYVQCSDGQVALNQT